ncbi:hypothetical protein [Pedobacter sp. MC2016-24]|uniref:hypothetical protein n=1 Tax=Pedobacter sp. MC2016-24 TaxID=2780090 RepID=UPI0018802730|nr:hypothetical protein [Pedobacter sp. MC2016-24]MBE9600964.1 hypothetical protein [Pedobacter sp. MC2016-24]
MNTLKNRNVFFMLLAGLLALTSCKKEVSFEGADNYITSFSLNQSGSVIYAAISDRSITLKAPEGLSLDQAKVAVVLSENATIYPDPSSITEWDDEMQFVVTAHNGTKQTYKYTVVRSSIAAEETIILPTQADVDAFGKQGITEIKGSLIIGRVTGKDSVTSLAPLSKLKKIGYSFTLYPTYSGKDLIGLENLERIGADLQIEGVRSLQNIVFGNLVNAGSIYIKSPVAVSFEFPSLKTVNKTLTLDGPIAGVSLPGLSTVGGLLSLNTASNSGAMLSKVAFPSLKETGGLSFTYFTKLEKIDLSELLKTGDFNMVSLAGLYTISAPKLQTATGKITIPTTSALREVSFPALVQAGGLSIEAKTLNSLEFPVLKTVSGILKVNNIAVDGIKNFTALTEVGTELYLGELTKMTSFGLPAGLKKIGKLTIYNRLVAVPAEINVKGLTVAELNMQTTGSVKLIGDDVFKGTLTINPTALTNFPVLQGFSEVDSLGFNGYISNINDVQINGIKKINKSFLMPNNNVKTFSMPDLEEVGGNFTINHFNGVTQATIEIPKLKKIGGDFNVQIQSTLVSTLKFTALTTVGGNFNLGTGYSTRCLTNVLFPVLEKVGKKLSIYAQNDSQSYVNNKVTNLDGFSALKNVTAIDVKAQTSLVSFAGFKNAFASISATSWTTSKNAYNPTYADLAAGRWTNN